MNFEQYRPLALRTAKIFPSARENLRHAAMGLVTEVGEFMSEVKRVVVYGKPMTDEMRYHMIEELGDIQWYCPLGLLALGSDKHSLTEQQVQVMLDEMRDYSFADASVYLAGVCGAIPAGVMTGEAQGLDRETMIDVFIGIPVMIDHMILPHLNIAGDRVREQNIAKLAKRYPDKYSDAAAEARADKGGLPHTAS